MQAQPLTQSRHGFNHPKTMMLSGRSSSKHGLGMPAVSGCALIDDAPSLPRLPDGTDQNDSACVNNGRHSCVARDCAAIEASTATSLRPRQSHFSIVEKLMNNASAMGGRQKKVEGPKRKPILASARGSAGKWAAGLACESLINPPDFELK
jgi:hypothetical protein